MEEYDVKNMTPEQKEALLEALRIMLENDIVDSIRLFIKTK